MSSRGYGSRSPFQTGSGNSVTLTAGSGLSSVGSILSVNVGNALSINSVGNKVDVNIADGLYVSNTNKICTLSSAECGSGPIKNNGAGASGYSICVFVAGSVSAFPYSVNYQNWPGSWPSSGQSITVVNGGCGGGGGGCQSVGAQGGSTNGPSRSPTTNAGGGIGGVPLDYWAGGPGISYAGGTYGAGSPDAKVAYTAPANSGNGGSSGGAGGSGIFILSIDS